MIRPRKTRAPHPQPILVLREKLEQSWWFSEIVREMRVVVELLTNFSRQLQIYLSVKRPAALKWLQSAPILSLSRSSCWSAGERQ